MAHWFHRNPLKATAPVKFDFGAQASTPLARHMCNDIRQAREKLLALLPDPNQDLGVLHAAAEAYFSLLRGFIEPTEGAKQASKKEEPARPEASSELGVEVLDDDEAAGGSSLGSGDSKLRNAVKVKWSNTLGLPPMVMRDMVFEHINMLFNVALWYSKHAAKLAGSQQEISEVEAKEIHRCLRSAAGMFKYIEESLVPKLFEKQGGGTDLDTRILQAYTLQCTAEAQEVTLARAISLNHTSSLVSALAHETARLFRKASDTLKSVDEKLVDKWRKYLDLKTAFYMSQAHCNNATTLLNKDQCGEAVRSSKESDRMYEKSLLLCKEYAQTRGPGESVRPEQHPFFRSLRPTVKRILEKTERENGMIYHQRVPEEVPDLEIKATYGLASPIEYEAPAKSKEWTGEVYAGFRLATQNPTEKKNDKDEPIKPVKEVPIEQTDKDQNSCVIS